jgi:hypothetical protein
MADNLMSLVAAHHEARAAYDVAKKLSDDAHREWRDRERALIDYMLEQGVQKISCDDGTTPTLVQGVSISVTQENFDAIRAYLREKTGDDADFIVTIPHKPTILEWVKKQAAAGEDDFPDFLKFDTRPTMRVVGWKGRE